MAPSLARSVLVLSDLGALRGALASLRRCGRFDHLVTHPANGHMQGGEGGRARTRRAPSPSPPTQIALNSLWLLLARVGTQALSLVFTIAVARGLGQAGFGQYALIAAVIFLGNVLTTFGMDTLLLREIGRIRRTGSPMMAAGLWLQLILSALLVGSLLIGVGFLPGKTQETQLALKIAAFSLFPLAFYTIFSAALRAFERMDLFLLLNLAAGFMQTCGAWLVLRAGGGVLGLAVLLLVSQTLMAILAGMLCTRRLPGFSFPWSASREGLLAALRLGWRFALLAWLGVLAQRVGLVLLSFLAGDGATGQFAAAARVVEALKTGHYAILGALFPALSRLQYDEQHLGGAVRRKAIENASRRAFLPLLVLSFMLALIMTFLAGPLTAFLFGADFAASAPALEALIWILLPYTVSAVISLDLVTAGRETVVVLALAISLSLTAALLAFLVPRIRMLGACVASIFGESAQAALLFLLSRRDESGGPQRGELP